MPYAATDTAGGGAVHSNLKVIGGPTIIEGTFVAKSTVSLQGDTEITNLKLTSYDTVTGQVIAGNTSADIDLSGLNPPDGLPPGCYSVFFLIYTNADPAVYLNSLSAVMNKGAASSALILSCYYPGFAQVIGKDGSANTITFENLSANTIQVVTNLVYQGSTPALAVTR
jgi:hypothetical protein